VASLVKLAIAAVARKKRSEIRQPSRREDVILAFASLHPVYIDFFVPVFPVPPVVQFHPDSFDPRETLPVKMSVVGKRLVDILLAHDKERRDVNQAQRLG